MTGRSPPHDANAAPPPPPTPQLPRPGARVFLLKFAEEPSRNLLFWAQERSAERDEEDVAAVTAALNQIEGEAKPMGPQALMCAKPGAPHQPRG